MNVNIHLNIQERKESDYSILIRRRFLSGIALGIKALIVIALSSCSLSQNFLSPDSVSSNSNASVKDAASVKDLAGTFSAETQLSSEQSGPQDRSPANGLQAADLSKDIRDLSPVAQPTNDQAVTGIPAEPELPALSALVSVKGHLAPIVKVFVPVEQSAVALSVDSSGKVLLWDRASGKAGSLFDLGETPDALEFSARGAFLVYVKGSVSTLISLSEQKQINQLTSIRSRLASVAFQPGNNSVILGGVDGRIYRWIFDPKKPDRFVSIRRTGPDNLERYIGPASIIGVVGFHPSGRVFFSGDWRGALSAWLTYDSDAFAGRLDKNLFGSGLYADKADRLQSGRSDIQPLTQLKMNADGTSLFAGIQDGRVEWWLVRGFRKIGEVQAHKGLLYDIAVNPAGTRFASVGRDGKVRVYAVSRQPGVTPEMKSELEFELSMPTARALAFASDEIVLAGGTDGKLVEVKK